MTTVKVYIILVIYTFFVFFGGVTMVKKYIELQQYYSDCNIEDKNRIDELISSIDVKNSVSVLNYGKKLGKDLSKISRALLEDAQEYDIQSITLITQPLLSSINTLDLSKITEQKRGVASFVSKLLKVDNLKDLKEKYSSVKDVIDGARDGLESAIIQLTKDIESSEIYKNYLLEHIRELNLHIVAAVLVIDNVGNNLDSFSDNEKIFVKNSLDALERKIEDLRIFQGIAQQNIIQIEMVQRGNIALVEKLDNSVYTIIPLWEQQMCTALYISRQKSAVELQKGIVNTTNTMILENGRRLNDSVIDVAKSLERSNIDSSTIISTNKLLMDTLKEVENITKSVNMLSNEFVLSESRV